MDSGGECKGARVEVQRPLQPVGDTVGTGIGRRVLSRTVRRAGGGRLPGIIGDAATAVWMARRTVRARQ